MQAEALLRESKLDEAIEALGSYLREHPADARSRTSLFEFLCFNGDLERARKHLALLGGASRESAVAILLYEGAIQAEETRRSLFESGSSPPDLNAGAAFTGEINGRPFSSLSDSDPRIGSRLELFVAGEYLWIPFQHIASIHIQPPTRLRDLLWTPAFVRTGPDFEGRDLGEVLLPALSPSTYMHPDAAVRLGRVTEWCVDEKDQELPYGQKTLLVDNEEVPFLEIRSLTITTPRESLT